MIKLSSRLQAISAFVNGSHMIDIGCDHGLLDIYLAQKFEYMDIIASDVNEKALNNAKRNIVKYQLENRIETRLSNGLEDIEVENCDCLVISGMGSHTIVSILYQNYRKLKNISTLVLQSNNDLDFLRYKVVKLGYYIEKERLVKDAGIIYTVIRFKKGHRIYSKKDLYFGPCLRRENSALFQEKCRIELSKLEDFYPLIPKRHFHHRRVTYWKIKVLRSILGEK